MNKYYITTDSHSQEIIANDIPSALREFGAPPWVEWEEDFEEWLTDIGGYGEIHEEGVLIAKVAS